LPDTSFNYVLTVQAGSLLFVLIFTIQEYTCFAVTRLRLMRQLHSYEYKRHYQSLASLQLAQGFALAYAIVGLYSVVLVSSCNLAE